VVKGRIEGANDLEVSKGVLGVFNFLIDTFSLFEYIVDVIVLTYSSRVSECDLSV
jgi:hypothetical protein